MDINAGKVPGFVNSFLSVSAVVSSAEGASNNPNPVKPEAMTDQIQSNGDVNELSNDEISEITDQLNKFMQTINTELRFEIHEKTNRIMVQVVDFKENKVIKEFPPRELLDTLAAISDYIGVLLDKKA